MAVRPRYIKFEETPKTVPGDRSPVVTLLYLSGQGIVFRSRRHFDTGTKLAIGLHLGKVREDLGLSKSSSPFDDEPFLDIEGFVADCKLMEVMTGGASYQVTLLFDSLGDSDEMLIEAIGREVKSKNPAPPCRVPRPEAGLN
jgi:hypothetical protein